MSVLIESSVEDVEQLLGFLNELPDEYYSAVPEGVQFGVGRHLRHILDLYSSLERSSDTGLIDYNIRDRGSRLETDPSVGRAALHELLEWLRALDEELTATVKIRTEVSTHAEQSLELESTMARELVFVNIHLIHHLAYMALIARLLGVDVAAAYGLAPATATYEREAVDDSLAEISSSGVS